MSMRFLSLLMVAKIIESVLLSSRVCPCALRSSFISIPKIKTENFLKLGSTSFR